MAAHLSLGIKPNAFGHKIDSLEWLGFEGPFIKEGKLLGEILHIDAFGNLISNIDEGKLFRFIQRSPFCHPSREENYPWFEERILGR